MGFQVPPDIFVRGKASCVFQKVIAGVEKNSPLPPCSYHNAMPKYGAFWKSIQGFGGIVIPHVINAHSNRIAGQILSQIYLFQNVKQ